MIEVLRSPDEFRAAYPFIEEGMNAIKAYAPAMDTIAADVYAAVTSRSVDFALITDAEKICGWVTFFRENGYDNRSTIVVWMCYIRPGSSGRCLAELVDWTEGLAREAECETIRFATTRTAWERRLRQHGYRITSVNLEKEVGTDE